MPKKEEKKEVKREEIQAHPELYHPHVTEKLLVNQVKEEIATFAYSSSNCLGSLKWSGTVYAELPFGIETRGIFTSQFGEKKAVSAKASFDSDNKKINISIVFDGKKTKKTIEHVIIEHGYMNYSEDSTTLEIEVVEDEEVIQAGFASNVKPLNFKKRNTRKQPVYEEQRMPIFINEDC